MQQESFDAECLGTSDLTHTAQVVIANPHALINKSPPPDTHSFVVEKRLSHQGVNFDFYKQLTTQEWYLGVVFPSTATHNDTIEQLKVVGVTPENDFHSLQDLIHRVVDLSKDLTPHVPMDRYFSFIRLYFRSTLPSNFNNFFSVSLFLPRFQRHSCKFFKGESYCHLQNLPNQLSL
jgi:hypothetical protein